MDGSEILDEVLVAVFKGPKSYTGEDLVEISLHGSPFIMQRMLQLLSEQNVRMATAGEFTRRAYLNGKMDLTQAEAVADLIAAESQVAANLAMNQMRGGFGQEIRQLRDKLLEFTALVELELDFSEEDVAFADRSALNNLLSEAIQRTESLAASFTLGNVLKSGIPVAILGPPNAGKSTLLNALLREERALVSPVAGTTRDTVEDEINLGGMVFRFIDTAGIRETGDEIEKMGIQRSLQALEKAEMLIYLSDINAVSYPTALAQAGFLCDKAGKTEIPVFIVGNKVDTASAIPDEWDKADALISAQKGIGIPELEEKMVSWFKERMESRDTLVIQARHAAALSKAAVSLRMCREGLHSGLSGELFSMDLRAATGILSELLGEVQNDEVLGAIFSRFCIGK
jgi:tRNA modification GTPase